MTNAIETAESSRTSVSGFGKTVTADEVEQALLEACRRGHAEVVDFTVAPREPLPIPSRCGHEWLIEFAEPPRAPDVFARVLDVTLRRLNSDYGTRRAGDSGILPPRILEVPAGTFSRWMRAHGARGGTVPRVAADRIIADSLLAVAIAHGSGPLIAITL
jgi:hypothetical protein